MNILGIETSSEKGSCAFLDDGTLVEKVFPKPKQHSQYLLKGIYQVLLKKDIQKIQGIAVSIGPGSFTGIRIGVTVARALGQSLSIPVAGIPSLDGLAWNLIFSNQQSPTESVYSGLVRSHRTAISNQQLICSLIDALRGEVYTALYEKIRNPKSEIRNLKKISDYRLMKIENLLTELVEKDEEIIFLGNGVKLHKEIIKEKLGKRARFAPLTQQFPHASTITRLGLQEIQKGKGKNYSKIKPLYIRRSEAEEKFC